MCNAVNTNTKPGYNYFLLLVAGLGGLLFGVDVGIISGALPYLEATSGLNANQLSFIVAAVSLGGVISTLFAGALADFCRCYAFTSLIRCRKKLAPEFHSHVLGGQANLWTEYIPNLRQVEYMMFPRLGALSEVDWSPKEIRDWDNFTARTTQNEKRLDALGVNYRPFAKPE